MNLRNNSYTKESFAICYIMFFEYVNYFAHSVLKLLGLQVYNVTITLAGVVLVLLIYLISKNHATVLPALVLPLIVTGLYFLSILFNAEGAEFIQKSVAEKLFLYCIPTYIAVRLISNYENFYNMLGKFCALILFTETLAILCMTYFPERFIDTDYQGISYGLLIPFIYFVGKEKYYIRTIAAIILAGVLLLFFGGRGPILCALICVCYRLLLNINKNKIWILVILLVSILLFYFYDDILNIIVSIAKENNFAGSIVKYAELGDIFSDSGRNEILEVAKEVVQERPWGSGLGSTRYLLGVYGF